MGLIIFYIACTRDSATNITSVLLAISLQRCSRVLPSECNLSKIITLSCPASTADTLASFVRTIAVDIIGPLPRSRSGKKYVLVICDYAIRYPEAIPLHSTDASHIAEALMSVFSRMGIPSEILTDQGSNFTLQLLTELYLMLRVHPIRTSPYHNKQMGW